MTEPTLGRLDEQVKERWLMALRSGVFLQGQKRLKKVDKDGLMKHCCLGVLCELFPERLEQKPVPASYSEDGSIEGLVRIHSFRDTLLDTYVYKASIPPETFNNDIGLTSTAISRLVGMNDDGASFEEIANFIEEEL